ncbi:alpha/beta hydrolase [Streptococcus chenjunshii]|uniref:Alpha/beta hydrolase n=1 Tax=Streptococcus chenjunshii TaxID=2173853 RepID=A0A372KJU0_9STRE|nr:alpha/beta hydrolase [Streptococcus chenjunshii]AXQ78381.1 alpha/beta hydrolase [Streptococcus chenjunshii]RFU50340.1 alpha/beta hydrolase [Streptococcus chenjunshii]RFU52545.1 alpha/beta hydrolase [Streptococcus chenjunshii]
MSIFKNDLCRKASYILYDYQLTLLDSPIKDYYIHTHYGRTHVIETGNDSGRPLLLFHGGNMSAAFNLLLQNYLFSDFHIFSADIIGQPGKSDDFQDKHYLQKYGLWAAEAIEQLGYDKMPCHGLSYGAGILLQLMSLCPEKIEKAVLEVPSGINNKLGRAFFKMALPLLLYQLTKKENYLRKVAAVMTYGHFSKSQEFLFSLKDTFDHVKIKGRIPPNISSDSLRDYQTPTLVIAAEKDCFFPSKYILPQAKAVIPHCGLYELKSRGHLHDLTEHEKAVIINFYK